jgi:hypothetical protein
MMMQVVGSYWGSARDRIDPLVVRSSSLYQCPFTVGDALTVLNVSALKSSFRPRRQVEDSVAMSLSTSKVRYQQDVMMCSVIGCASRMRNINSKPGPRPN